MAEPPLTPERVLRAYAAGLFPMAENRDDPALFWVDPDWRGVLPLDGFHISRSLRKTILAAPYEPRFNSDFSGVVAACAARDETWISDRIADIYQQLHHLGHAHSQELWQGDALVGGVYGVSLGATFFGESMFSHRRDASKIALAYLVDRLRLTAFTLFDTQFITPHLQRLGAVEISRQDYLAQLQSALAQTADITRLDQLQRPQDVIQRNTQIS